MSVIFFCPVGKTDPMSIYRNAETGEIEAFDASMMHIYRRYCPDYTYLYMTEEIYSIEMEQEHRYTKAMGLLADSLGKTFIEDQDYSILHSSITDEVYNMDVFYDEFYQMITDIRHKYGSGATIIINISSGTPAMKSALFVLQSMRNIKGKLVQALDPYPKKRTEHMDVYDVNELFKRNVDRKLSDTLSKDKVSYRLRDVSNRNLNSMKISEIMKNLIDAYDYDAALQVFTSFFFNEESDITDKSRNLQDFLKFASYRKMQTLHKLKSKKGHEYESLKVQYIPFFEPTGNKYACTEYVLKLRLSFDGGEYTDAIRAMTPLDTKLLSLVFNNLTGLEIQKYINNKTGCFLENGSFPKEFSKHFKRAFYEKDSTSIMLGPASLKKLIHVVMDPQKKRELKDAIDGIVEVENRLRNLVAHTMTTITEEKFLEDTGLKSVEQLFGYYDTLLENAGYNLQHFDWHAYEIMNNDIKKLINEVL